MYWDDENLDIFPYEKRQKRYFCGNNLLKIEKNRLFLYNILILDLYEAYCARIYSDGEVEKVFDITSSVPNKHKAGGQSQRRFERIREGCITEWFKRINEHLKEIEGKTFVGISFVYENRFKSYLSTENLNKIEKFDKIEYTGLCGIYQFKSSIERFIKLN